MRNHFGSGHLEPNTSICKMPSQGVSQKWHHIVVRRAKKNVETNRNTTVEAAYDRQMSTPVFSP